MIVRDEAAVIERCLASVRDHIDTWVICDTGSEDDTPERVERALGGITGTLHRSRWRDFGANRSELMGLAAGSADYLLLIDADMTLRVEGPLPELTHDVYLLRHDGPVDYAVPRLVRANRKWRFQGSTHEHLAADGPYTQEVLDAVVVEHHADGAHRADKQRRDIRLLKRDLDQRPDDPRAIFYLAQTYRDLGDEERAIEYYRRRAELGGWDEEVFYALYQAGALLGRRDAAAGLPLLLSAWQRQPERAEPLHELARICRFQGWHQTARTFAAQGLELPYPRDRLFVIRWIYEWGLRYEFALAAFETGEQEEAVAAAEELLRVPGLPEDIEHHLLERLRPQRPVPDVAMLGELMPGTEIAEIRLDVSPDWPQFNPTIAAHGDGFALIVRTANYRHENGRYVLLTNGPVIRTLNYLVTLDGGLEVMDVEAMTEGLDGPPRFTSRIEGYEDCRLFTLEGDLLATATVRDRNPDERCETALLRLDGATVSVASVLAGPTPGRHEKNWMPFVRDSALHFLYSCDPTVVLRHEPGTGKVETVSRRPGPAEGNSLRGGSQGIAVGDGFLFVVHEAAESAGGRRYQHRFILLDDEYRLVAMTPRFHFLSPELEFCAGLARREGELLVTFGVGDRSALLAVLDEGRALAMLEPVLRPPSSRSQPGAR